MRTLDSVCFHSSACKIVLTSPAVSHVRTTTHGGSQTGKKPQSLNPKPQTPNPTLTLNEATVDAVSDST